MAITNTIDARQNTQVSFNSHCNNDLKIMTGYITFDGGDYAAGGIEVTFNQMPNPIFVKFNNADGYVVQYDISAGKVKLYEAGAVLAELDEEGTNAVATTCEFMAVGY